MNNSNGESQELFRQSFLLSWHMLHDFLVNFFAFRMSFPKLLILEPLLILSSVKWSIEEPQEHEYSTNFLEAEKLILHYYGTHCIERTQNSIMMNIFYKNKSFWYARLTDYRFCIENQRPIDQNINLYSDGRMISTYFELTF